MLPAKLHLKPIRVCAQRDGIERGRIYPSRTSVTCQDRIKCLISRTSTRDSTSVIPTDTSPCMSQSLHHVNTHKQYLNVSDCEGEQLRRPHIRWYKRRKKKKGTHSLLHGTYTHEHIHTLSQSISVTREEYTLCCCCDRTAWSDCAVAWDDKVLCWATRIVY